MTDSEAYWHRGLNWRPHAEQVCRGDAACIVGEFPSRYEGG